MLFDIFRFSHKKIGLSLWSEQPLAPPAEDVITGLEFLVDKKNIEKM